MKTSELTGTALDWAVAKAEGLLDDCEIEAGYVWDRGVLFSPTRNWNNCGPIIEREKIDTYYGEKGWWQAVAETNDVFAFGATPLIAAMRCYVASKLGDNVELPEELTHE